MADRKPLAAIGGRIRRRRTERGLSQEALAHEAGLSPPYVSQIERGERDFGVLALLRLTDALHTTPSALLVGDDLPATRDPVTALADRVLRWPAAKRKAAVQILKELESL